MLAKPPPRSAPAKPIPLKEQVGDSWVVESRWMSWTYPGNIVKYWRCQGMRVDSSSFGSTKCTYVCLMCITQSCMSWLNYMPCELRRSQRSSNTPRGSVHSLLRLPQFHMDWIGLDQTVQWGRRLVRCGHLSPKSCLERRIVCNFLQTP